MCMIEKDNKICGRVIKCKKRKYKSGKIFYYVNLYNQGKIYEIAIENKIGHIKRGDYIIVLGTWGILNEKKTYIVNKILFKVSPKEIEGLPFYLERGLIKEKMDLLFIRSKVIEEINGYFKNIHFLPVSSPAIVSNWVEGQTGNFKVSFYDHENCNLTLSNLVYHQVILSTGFSKIYEVTKLFRKENPSNRKRLAEYTTLELGMIQATAYEMMEIINGMILSIHKMLLANGISVPPNIKFEYIDYKVLLHKSGIQVLKGHQLPLRVREYLNSTYESFVWVTGFPIHTRPFYTKSESGYCFDGQLWYRGVMPFAAGGEYEDNMEIMINNLKNEKKKIERYEFLIKTYEFGRPPMVGFGIGIERMLATWLGGDLMAADFTFFPRYEKNYTP